VSDHLGHGEVAGEVQAVAELSSGDGPLSVRIRPSSLKRDCDRRATSTGEKCLVNVHAKSRLTPEPLRTLRSETKGQAGACPDRTREGSDEGYEPSLAAGAMPGVAVPLTCRLRK
jgi:hypothetical protein